MNNVVKAFVRLMKYSQPSVQFSSVAQSCPTLCDPTHCSTPGFPVHHQLPELAQTHVPRVSDATQPSHPFSSWLQSFPASGSFPISQFFESLGTHIKQGKVKTMKKGLNKDMKFTMFRIYCILHTELSLCFKVNSML